MPSTIHRAAEVSDFFSSCQSWCMNSYNERTLTMMSSWKYNYFCMQIITNNGFRLDCCHNLDSSAHALHDAGSFQPATLDLPEGKRIHGGGEKKRIHGGERKHGGGQRR